MSLPPQGKTFRVNKETYLYYFFPFKDLIYGLHSFDQIKRLLDFLLKQTQRGEGETLISWQDWMNCG